MLFYLIIILLSFWIDLSSQTPGRSRQRYRPRVNAQNPRPRRRTSNTLISPNPALRRSPATNNLQTYSDYDAPGVYYEDTRPRNSNISNDVPEVEAVPIETENAFQILLTELTSIDEIRKAFFSAPQYFEDVTDFYWVDIVNTGEDNIPKWALFRTSILYVEARKSIFNILRSSNIEVVFEEE